jgi:hypothetical protein
MFGGWVGGWDPFESSTLGTPLGQDPVLPGKVKLGWKTVPVSNPQTFKAKKWNSPKIFCYGGHSSTNRS